MNYLSLKKITTIAMALIVALSLFSCGYNAMQKAEEDVFKSWADVESALQRRADLIPNLVATVKGAASHEQDTLTAVIEARSKATSVNLSTDDLNSAQAMAQFQQAQSSLSSALSKLMVVVEQYPELKANQNFLDLQVQLEGTENRINVARTRYNESVSSFNSMIRSFPNSLVNSLLLKLDKKEYYKADPASATAPVIQF